MNKIKIYSISISICVVFVCLLINSSHAQSVDNFKTYTNNDLKFTIQHPAKWKVDDRNNSTFFTIRENPEDDVEVLGLTVPGTSYFNVKVDEVPSEYDWDTLTLQNKSLEQYVQGVISLMPVNSETLLRQNQVTVGGNDGIKVEYKSDIDNQVHYGFNIYTIANGKLYDLEYKDKPLKVQETLPLVNKMVESFHVLD